MFKSARAYGDLNTYDALKLLALLTMVIDHLGAFLLQDVEWLRAVGRLAFPLFLFLVGFSARWQVKRDLLVWAGLIVICAGLTHHVILPFNVLVTIVLVRLAMIPVTQGQLGAGFLSFVFVMAAVFYPLFLWTDYSTLGLLFAVSGYLQRVRPRSVGTLVFLYATLLLHYAWQYVNFRFAPANVDIMVLMMALTAWIMYAFRIEQLTLRLGAPLQHMLAWGSRNTLALYALHVMLFMVIERLIYPDRLLEFKWM